MYNMENKYLMKSKKSYEKTHDHYIQLFFTCLCLSYYDVNGYTLYLYVLPIAYLYFRKIFFIQHLCVLSKEDLSYYTSLLIDFS